MLNILSVGLGGFIGAVCRYLIGLIPINETINFPIKTFAINVIGCVVIGIITALLLKFIDAYNQYIFTNKQKSILGRMDSHWDIENPVDIAKSCIACGNCERACTQHLPIIERMREIAAL